MTFSFLGLEQSPFELEHKEKLSGFLKQHPQPLSGFTFATLFTWQQFFHYGWSFVPPGALVVSGTLPGSPNRHLLQPVGPLSPELKSQLLEQAAQLPYALRIVGASRRFLEENSDLVSRFEVVDDRAAANYLYPTQELAELSGRRFSKKRNLIAQASHLYSWTTEPLSANEVEACREVLSAIHSEESPAMEPSLALDVAALNEILRCYAELEQQGVLIRVERRPVAFSIFEAMGPSTAVVHFERALRSYKGLYQVLNREVARAIVLHGFKLINREEDLGDAGLRKAKLSYHPSQIVSAFSLTFRR